jgi:tetratricopeptide (TPR) repeat protein
MRCVVSAALFLMMMTGAAIAQVDEADAAWRSGNTERAVQLYEARLAANPNDAVALHRLALARAWKSRFDESIALFDRLLRVDSMDIEVRIDRARVLGWALRWNDAEAEYTRLLQRNPQEMQALLGLANLRLMQGRTKEGEEMLDRILSQDPRNMEALRGRARAAAWRGNLVAAEERWRAVLALDAQSPETLAGLAQTLRWQGRDAAALDYIRTSLQANASDPGALEQLPWIEAALAPRLTPSFAYEHDSDGNRISSFSAGASFRPAPRWELRGDGYVRAARQDAAFTDSRTAFGGGLTLWTQFEPGWLVSAAAGASSSNADDAAVTGMYALTFATPARNIAALTMTAQRSALDATALLIARQVRSEEITGILTMTLPSVTRLVANASAGRYIGGISKQSNSRTAGGLSISRRVRPPLTLGVLARAFAFEHDDLFDGYFSPRFYGIAEVTGQYLRQRNEWTWNVELAPGVQRIGRSGDLSATARGAGGVTWSQRPGRSITMLVTLANAGSVALSPSAGGGYRYAAFTLTSRWGL